MADTGKIVALVNAIAGQQLASVKSKIQGLEVTVDSTIQREKKANLFNKDGELVENKYFKKNDGSLVDFSYSYCQYIPFEGEGQYSMLYPTDIYGYNSAVIWLFDEQKTALRSVPITLDEQTTPNTVAHFTVSASDTENVAYFGFVLFKNVLGTVMFVKQTTYPSQYIPYGYGDYVFVGNVPVENVEGLGTLLDGYFPVSPTNTTFIHKVKGTNLFNKNGEIETNKMINVSTGALTSYSGCSTQFIPFEGEGTYCSYYPINQYGLQSVKLCLYDEDKSFKKAISGTPLDNPSSATKQPASFVIGSSDAVGVSYLGYTFNNNDASTAMFVKASSYPDSYIPYTEIMALDNDIKAGINTLFGKVAVFDGDSICANATDSASKGSYAGRIGTNNNMSVTNYAVTGATITAGTYYQDESARHWVSRSIDTIYTNFKNPDFVIFEGGANDADVIGSILDSQNLPAKYGSWTEDDFSGSYDDETFCGAVESIIFKAMSYWPKSKIGFVIVMKMSTGNVRKNYYAYLKTIMDICNKWGVPYVNIWDNCPINPSLESCWDSTMTAAENIEAEKMYKDGQHPTPTGYDRIAPIIEAWMRTL